MDVTCRACLQTNEKLYNIFKHTHNDRTILSRLLEFVLVQPEIDDGLPQNICLICVEKLNMAHNFEIMFIESDLKLHSSNNVHVEGKNEELPAENNTDDPLSIANTEENSNNVDIERETEENSKEKNDELTVKNKVNISSVPNIQNNSAKVEEYSISHSKHLHSIIDSESDLNDSFEDSTYIQCETTIIENKNCKKTLSATIASNLRNILQNNEVVMMEKRSNLTQPQKSCSATVSCKSNASDVLMSPIQDAQDDSIEKRTECELAVHFLNVLNGTKSRGVSRKEQDQKMLLCNICDKSFAFRYYFDVHIHQHTGNMPYKCDHCGKFFAKRSLLNTHKQRHSEHGRYTCEVCGKRLRSTLAVQCHMVTHSDARPYKCNICGKTYKLQGSLKLHTQRHTKDKLCTCEICGRSFSLISDLRCHLIVHNTDKNFSCPTCGKSFSNKYYLNDHCKRHLNERSYACDKCDMSFNSKITLTNHVLIHTGEKPHACNICGRTFRQASCIPRHMRIHTGETPFSCGRCPLKFKYKHHLLKHMKKHE